MAVQQEVLPGKLVVRKQEVLLVGLVVQEQEALLGYVMVWKQDALHQREEPWGGAPWVGVVVRPS